MVTSDFPTYKENKKTQTMHSKLCFTYLVIVITMFSFLTQYVSTRDIKLGILIPWSAKSLNGNRVAGAVTRAIDDINNNTNILNNTFVTFVHRNSGCSSTLGVGGAMDLYSTNIDAYVGPLCSEACISAGMISTYKSVPMISYGCSNLKLSDKIEYPFFARTKPFARSSQLWTPKTFVTLCRSFNWNTVCLIDRVHEIYTPLTDAMIQEFQDTNITINKRESYYTEDTSFTGYKTILERMKDRCRGIS